MYEQQVGNSAVHGIFFLFFLFSWLRTCRCKKASNNINRSMLRCQLIKRCINSHPRYVQLVTIEFRLSSVLFNNFLHCRVSLFFLLLLLLSFASRITAITSNRINFRHVCVTICDLSTNVWRDGYEFCRSSHLRRDSYNVEGKKRDT